MFMEVAGEILKLTAFAGLVLAGILVILIWKKGLGTKITYLRFIIQIAALIGVYYLFTYSVWQLGVLIVILVIPLLLGRFFCGWLCPFGLYMDAITQTRKASKMRHRNIPDRLNKFLNVFRYFILLFFIALPFGLCLIDPPSSLDLAVVMAINFAGPFRPLSVLLGPLIPLIVPWVGPIQIGGLSLSYPYVQEILYYLSGISAAVFAWIFVALTVVGSFFVRRVWCRFCPTGASIAVLNRLRGLSWTPGLHIDKDEEKCTKCGICRRVCPVQVTEIYEQKGGKIATSMCTLCLRCVEMCPEQDCLKVSMARKTLFRSRNWLEPSSTE